MRATPVQRGESIETADGVGVVVEIGFYCDGEYQYVVDLGNGRLVEHFQ